MRFTVILVVLFAIAMVTLANKPKKALNKKLRKQAKIQARMQAKQQLACDVVTWDECGATEAGKITQSISANTSNPECVGTIVDTRTIHNTMDCETTTEKKGKVCTVTIIRDFTPCGAGSEFYTLMKNVDCPTKTHKNKKSTIQKVCNLRIDDNKRQRGGGAKAGAGAGAAKSKVKGLRKEKKMLRKQLAVLKKNGCVYQKSACTNKRMTWTRTAGDETTCDQTVDGPCLGFAKKISAACKYKNERWSDCNPLTNTKTKRRVLKRGDPLSCNETIVEEKPCKRKPRRIQESRCKYRKTQWSDCDPVSNEKTMIKTLKSRDTVSCPPTQTVKKVCKRKFKNSKKRKCAYRGQGKWSTCDKMTNMRTRTVILKKGKLKFCKPSMIETKPCKNKKRNKAKKGCRYDRNQWSPCDAATSTVTRTLTLTAGDPNICNATKTITRKCKDKHLRPHLCVYRRTTWGECDGVTNLVSMVKTLKRGDPSLCDPTKTVTKKCKRKKKADVCKYSKVDWSECDQRTNTMTKIQTLVSGPSTCPAVKEFSRKCKKPCKFTQGRWSECDAETQQMTRQDTLTKGNPDVCPPTRLLTKKCGKKAKKCHYEPGTWTECDSSEKPMRTRVQKLISGGENCKPEKLTSKSCQKNSGTDRCFFGPWSDFDECRNGVQKKRRQVLQGGLECERKGVKMKAC